ncbi:hypothetical protein LPJ61_000668 [Coemansia biformis]|uniref:Extracellular membrane protein CFEM domain-containing protein n=1 Tax=Coemansia biformis TaxID=1286918 RepID=A0A9W7YFU3_9FUNG|nr:hypothetical protein LPJ61_000668 [Coemansia biformis]
MHGLGVLAALCMVCRCMAAGPCRAQNILDACLRMQQLQFKSCQYDEWQCKCHGQKKILTCYDNCPKLEARTLQEMQVEVFCAPLNGKIFDSEMIDKMTRPVKLANAHHPTAASSASAPQPTSSSSKSGSSNSRDSLDRDRRSSSPGSATYSVLDNAAQPRALAAASPGILIAAVAIILAPLAL